jgi:hypothetical protein
MFINVVSPERAREREREREGGRWRERKIVINRPA